MSGAAGRFARVVARAARLARRPPPKPVDKFDEGAIEKIIDKVAEHKPLDGLEVPDVRNVGIVVDTISDMGQVADDASTLIGEKIPFLINQIRNAPEGQLLNSTKPINAMVRDMDMRYDTLAESAEILLNELKAIHADVPHAIHPTLIQDMERATLAIQEAQNAVLKVDLYLYKIRGNPEELPALIDSLEKVVESAAVAEEAIAAVEQTALALERNVGKVPLSSAVGGTAMANGSNQQQSVGEVILETLNDDRASNNDVAAGTYEQVSLDGTGLVGLYELATAMPEIIALTKQAARSVANNAIKSPEPGFLDQTIEKAKQKTALAWESAAKAADAPMIQSGPKLGL